MVGAGCGKSLAERTAEKVGEQSFNQEGVDVDIDADSGTGTYTFNDEKSGSNYTIGGGTLPAVLSAEISLPQDAVITSALDMPGNVQVSYTTVGSILSALAHHENELSSKGWKQDSRMITAISVYATFKKGEQAIQIGTFQETDDSTKISVSIALF